MIVFKLMRWSSIKDNTQRHRTVWVNETRQEEYRTQLCNVNIFLYSICRAASFKRRWDSRWKGFINEINSSAQFSAQRLPEAELMISLSRQTINGMKISQRFRELHPRCRLEKITHLLEGQRFKTRRVYLYRTCLNQMFLAEIFPSPRFVVKILHVGCDHTLNILKYTSTQSKGIIEWNLKWSLQKIRRVEKSVKWNAWTGACASRDQSAPKQR